MLTLNNISKVYNTNAGKVNALQGVSFCLPNKGLISIVGKSGSGKSTLLNILSGNDIPTDGSMFHNGKLISNNTDIYRTNTVGMIFQDNKLLKGLNVHDNIKIAMEIGGNNNGNIESILSLVGLNGYGKRLTNELSAGQAQRVAVARAIAKGANIILADEPTGNLDTENAKHIFELLQSLSAEVLVILVTHDKDSANKYSDMIIELMDGTISSITKINSLSDSTYATEKNITITSNANKKNELGKLRLPTKIAMTKWVYDKIGLKTVMLSLISVFMLVLTVVSAGLFSTSYSQSLSGKLSKDDDFLLVKNKQLFLNNSDIKTIENKSGNRLQKGVSLANINTIKLYNPIKTDAENELLASNLYFSDGLYLNKLIGVNGNSKINLLAGRMPSNPWEICLPSIFAESIIEYGAYPNQDPKLMFLSKYEVDDVVRINNIEDIIGKEVLYSSNDKYNKFVIVGFFQSSTSEYEWLKDVRDINSGTEKEKTKIEMYSNSLKSMSQTGMGLISDTFMQEFITLDKSLDKLIPSQSHFLEYHGVSYTLSNTNMGNDIEYAEGKNADLALKYDIVIPRAMALEKGLKLGENIFISLDNTVTKEKLNFKIIGYHENDFIISNPLMLDLKSEDNYRIYNNFVFNNFNDKDYKTFYKYLTVNLQLDKTSLEYSTASSYGLDEAMSTFEDLKYLLFLPMILIFFVLSVVFISALVSDFTAMKASDIGTLRAMGLRKSEIYKIFLIALGWQLLIEFALALLIGGIVFGAINAMLISKINLFVDILFMNLLTVSILLLTVIAIIPLGILAPIKKKNKKMPQLLMNK